MCVQQVGRRKKENLILIQSSWFRRSARPRAGILTPEVAVVGRHHQQLGLGVLDNVTPVDGVRVAQEFVLVDVNTPVQYLCTRRKRRKEKKQTESNEHTGVGHTAHGEDGRKSTFQGELPALLSKHEPH